MTAWAFLGGTIGPMELLLVLTAILLLFGADRLPEMARRLGRLMNQLRDASDEVRQQILNPPPERLSGPDKPAAPVPPQSNPEEPHDRMG